MPEALNKFAFELFLGYLFLSGIFFIVLPLCLGGKALFSKKGKKWPKGKRTGFIWLCLFYISIGIISLFLVPVKLNMHFAWSLFTFILLLIHPLYYMKMNSSIPDENS